MTPAERLRQHQRSLQKAQRELEREKGKLEAQEKKTMADIKKNAKAGNMVSQRANRGRPVGSNHTTKRTPSHGVWQADIPPTGHPSRITLAYTRSHIVWPSPIHRPLLILERVQDSGQRPRPYPTVHSEIHPDASTAPSGFAPDADIEK